MENNKNFFVYNIKGSIGKKVLLKNIKKDFLNIPKDEVIHLYIDSSGGDLDEAFYIYNFFSTYTNIKTFNIKAQSAATVLSLIPNKIENRFYKKNTQFLIHPPYISDKNFCSENVCDADFLEYAKDYIKNKEDLLIDFYSLKTSVPKNRLMSLLKENRNLKESEILHYNFLSFHDFQNK